MTRLMRLAILVALGCLLGLVTQPAWLGPGVTPAHGAITQAGVPETTTLESNGPETASARLGMMRPLFPVAGLAKGFGGAADLWFRPEPTRNRWYAAPSVQHRALMLTLDYQRSLTGTLDGPGWHLMVGTAIRRERGELSPGASPFRLESLRSALGRRWLSSGLQVSILGGVSRVALDPDSMARTGLARTGRGERVGAFASVQLWQEWPQGGPMGLRFGQLYLEADQARASLGFAARLGFPLGFGTTTIGPEFLISAGERWRIGYHTYRHPYRHVRIGAHLGGIRLNKVSLSVSAGGVFSSREGPRAYAAFGLSLAY